MNQLVPIAAHVPALVAAAGERAQRRFWEFSNRITPISTRDNLRQKRDTVVTQIAAIDEQWKLIAYKAHTGDSAAETKLIKLNRDRLVLTDDEVTIAVALEARIQEEERLL